jgi:capsular exopolysaccharide synthesis family protein
MSRVHQALKRAGLAVPQQTELPPGGSAQEPGAISHDVPPMPGASILSSGPPLVSPPDPAFASIGTPTKVVMDEGARLIPHTVDPAVVEHYRRLRTKILHQQANTHFSSLMITSPGPQEGKTVTVINLGLSFALLPSFKVLMVDGDLRRGSLGNWLGMDENTPGLSNLLEGSVALEDVVLQCDDTPFAFIMRGNSKVPPAELLQSPQLASHFRAMGKHFDLVLVDSAPVNLLTDTQLLAGGCDAIVLIARAFTTTHKALKNAIQDLSPFNVIGTVLNGGPRSRISWRNRNYYYYQRPQK